jgi:RNA polymerase sigma-70 factor (ECF subfamily)
MNTTSFSLLARLHQRDAPDAWERFLQLYTPLLFYWAKRVGLPPSEADDIVQDVLLTVWGKLATFEHRGSGSFRAWLRTVAINKCREHLRRQKVSVPLGDTLLADRINSAAVSDPFWEAEYRQHLVARALEIMQAEFEATTWQACWQRVVEERPAAEVARNLGLSEGAVYVYTGRVLRRLRTELEGLLE